MAQDSVQIHAEAYEITSMKARSSEHAPLNLLAIALV